MIKVTELSEFSDKINMYISGFVNRILIKQLFNEKKIELLEIRYILKNFDIFEFLESISSRYKTKD